MELKNQLDMLKQLCELDAVPGCEDRAAQWIQENLPKDVAARRDVRGNLICEKKGKKTPNHKMMITAHMDEPGFIITYIEESGLLRFSMMGEIDTRMVVGKAVRLESGKEGVVGAKPIHLQSAEERDQVLKTSALYIDIGAKTREEAEQFVQLGDFAVWRSEFTEMGNKVRAKALGRSVTSLLLLDLLYEDTEYDFTAVFGAQHQIGGAVMNAAFEINPEIAISIDCAAAGDFPGVGEAECISRTGKGPVLSFQNKGVFTDSTLFETAKEICKDKEISYQMKTKVTEGTDAKELSKVAGGCRVLPVAVSVRNEISPTAVFDPSDLKPTLKLLKHLVKRLGE